MSVPSWLLLVFLFFVTGCHYYQDYRQKKGEADITEERANLMKAYRACLEKYEGDVAGMREQCDPYQKMLQPFDNNLTSH